MENDDELTLLLVLADPEVQLIGDAPNRNVSGRLAEEIVFVVVESTFDDLVVHLFVLVDNVMVGFTDYLLI